MSFYIIFYYIKDNQKIYLRNHKIDENDCEILLYGGASDSADKLGTVYINKDFINDIFKKQSIYIENIGAYFEEFFMPYSKDLNKKYIIK